METLTTTRQLPSTPWDRMMARVRGGHLDDRLARGADPREDARLRARAAWLTSPRCRAGLARALLDTLDQARRTGAVVDTRITVQKHAVLEAEPHIVRLAGALRSRRNLAPGPVARVRRLLSDGKGALYTGKGTSAVVEDLAAELDGMD